MRYMERKDVRKTFSYVAGCAWEEIIRLHPEYGILPEKIFYQNTPILSLQPTVDPSESASSAIVGMYGTTSNHNVIGDKQTQIDHFGSFIIQVRTNANVDYGMDVNDDITDVFEDILSTADWYIEHKKYVIAQNEYNTAKNIPSIVIADDFNLCLPKKVYVRETDSNTDWALSIVEAPFTYTRTISKG